MKTARALRAAIERHQDGRVYQAFRYPLQLKQAVAAFTKAQRLADVSYETLCSDLGLPINTLRRWCEGSPPGRLTSVEVTPDAASTSPVLVTRSGHRVEGLSVAALCDLLEQLS